MSFIQSMKDFTPTKTTLFWTAAGAGVLTIVLGFSYGGWKTGGAADEMARTAATAAHTELAARICVENFAADPQAIALRDEMMAAATSRQRSFVQERPWALMPGDSAAGRQVAELCARYITEMGDERLLAIEEASMVLPDTAEPVTEVDPG